MMYPHTRKKQKTEELNQQSQRMDASEQNETKSAIVRRNKPPEISIPKEKSEKYKSDGGTPALLEKLSLFPQAIDIESIGEPKQGAQAKADFAMITTPSQSEIPVFRKKQKKGESSNEFTITNSIKKNSDYKRVKSYLSIPFYEEKRSSGNMTLSRIKINGDLDGYRNYIKKNSSEAQLYLFHQTTNLVETLDFLHNQTFIDEQGNQHRGIIHGDIKPDNLLVDKKGNLSLSDFGCARYADKPIEQPGMVSYLSPELLKFAGGIPSNPDKSDIWSLGVTLQSLVTGEYPIAPPPQSLSIDLTCIQNDKDARGYTVVPQSTSRGSMYIQTEKNASGYSIITGNKPSEESRADNFGHFFSDTAQGHEVRKNKADQYLQSTTCENNLNSKRFIDDICKKPYQNDIDKREVFRHLTSSMLSPVEARPTAKELSITMEKLVHYFPWDQKNNTEFVKKMTEHNNPIAEETTFALFNEEKKQKEQPLSKLFADRHPHKKLFESALGGASFNNPSSKETNPALLHQEEKKPIEQPLSNPSADRQAHKKLLDSALGGTSFNNSISMETRPALFFKEEKKQIEQPLSKLSVDRQAHKKILESALGGTSFTSSFFHQNSAQTTQEDESEKKKKSEEIKSQIKLMWRG